MYPMYEVTERCYSWGTLVSLYRDGIRVASADVYRDGTYSMFEGTDARNVRVMS